MWTISGKMPRWTAKGAGELPGWAQQIRLHGGLLVGAAGRIHSSWSTRTCTGSSGDCVIQQWIPFATGAFSTEAWSYGRASKSFPSAGWECLRRFGEDHQSETPQRQIRPQFQGLVKLVSISIPTAQFYHLRWGEWPCEPTETVFGAGCMLDALEKELPFWLWIYC